MTRFLDGPYNREFRRSKGKNEFNRFPTRLRTGDGLLAFDLITGGDGKRGIGSFLTLIVSLDLDLIN